MQIINKITIKYFRSLHDVDLKKCLSLNVISGRNDVGKSNILKALNLFFNEQTDWESKYVFYDNFSNKRLEEVRKDSVKGKQFISIKIEFIRPNNYKGSLPRKFTVERRWNRDSKTFDNIDNLSSLEKSGKLPSSLTTAQRSLAKFLNRIHFEYVPAIKDRTYVNDLLARLQRTLIDMTIESNEDFLETANNLAEHIENQITELKEDFENATEIETSIKPPSNISSLFQSFLVSTETDDGNVPLIFRGDGLQSRYIASVLHYIAMKSNDFYIWGYEEPEIALEYTHASKMAQDFDERYSDCAQIFITTHSPAFISLENESVSCYRVSQDSSVTIVANTALDADLKGKEKLKEELGILDIQKEVHEYYSSELTKLKKASDRVSELEVEINEQHKPLVVTEGKTDKKILDIAAEKLGVNIPDILIRACDNSGGDGSNGGTGTLARLIESIHPEDERVVIAIFDNDEEGQKEFNTLSKNFKKADWNNEIKMHKNGFAWAMLLPEPEFREGYVSAKNLSIEYLFVDDVLEQEFQNGRKLELKDPLAHLIFAGHRQNDIPDEVREFISQKAKPYKKVGAGKDEFSEEIIPNLNIEDFDSFRNIFDSINQILDS